MNISAIIPARGGSKGIPRKNLRSLAGKPLIAHSILDVHESQLVSKVYVSTDDEEIADVSQKYGAEIIYRPADLASDTSSSESTLIHALSELENRQIVLDLIVFLQCTSPIRTGSDIDQAIRKIQADNSDSLLSAVPTHRFFWKEWHGVANPINYDYRHRPRRQDMNPQYIENGSIYIFKPWVLKEYRNRLGGKITLFPMSEASAHEIDSPLDFEIAQLLMKYH